MPNRLCYKLGYKLQLAKEASLTSIRSISRKYNVSRQCIQKWKSQIETLKEADYKHARARLSSNITVATSKGSKYPNLEEKVLAWILEQRTLCNSVSGLSIKARAMTVATELHLHGFNASAGWLSRFLKRSGLSLRRVTTSGRMLPADGVEQALDHIEAVNHHIQLHNIQEKQFVNFDETTLYLDMPSNYTYDSIGTQRVKIATNGAQQVRISICFAAAADGTKLKPVILIPRVNPLPDFVPPDNVVVSYFTAQTFNQATIKSEFLDRVLIPFKMQNQHSKLFLLLDQATAHTTEQIKNYLISNQIDAIYIPKRVTGLLQSADVGWMRPLKLKFRQKWEDWMQNCEPYTPQGNTRSPGYKLAIQWISSIWQEFDPEIIRRSFECCGIFQTEHAGFHYSLRDYLETETIDRVVDRDRADEIIGFNQESNEYESESEDED